MPYIPYINVLYFLAYPIFFSLPYIFELTLYFPEFSLYALYFHKFHQINRLNLKEATQIPWFHGLTGLKSLSSFSFLNAHLGGLYAKQYFRTISYTYSTQYKPLLWTTAVRNPAKRCFCVPIFALYQPIFSWR